MEGGEFNRGGGREGKVQMSRTLINGPYHRAIHSNRSGHTVYFSIRWFSPAFSDSRSSGKVEFCAVGMDVLS